MTWYKMGKKKTIKEAQQKMEKWMENSTDEEIDEKFDEKLTAVAEENGFFKFYKNDALLFFRNENDEIAVAYHNEHDFNYGPSAEGFDVDADIRTMYNEEQISHADLINIFSEIYDIDLLPQKQQDALYDIFEYCALDDDEKKYGENQYIPEQYQNIYNNIFKNKKSKSKSRIMHFLDDLDCF